VTPHARRARAAEFRVWRAWTAACAAGELVGVASAAAVAALVSRAVGEPVGLAAALLIAAGMALAGLAEGSSIAWFQWRVLRRRLPRVAFRPWLHATAGVAVLAWLLGSGASLLAAAGAADDGAPQPPLPVIAFISAGFGLAAGALFGGAQWLVLRRQVRGGWRWIAGNALGWAVAVPWISVAAALPSEHAAWQRIVGLGVAAGVLAGASVGAVTGVVLLRLRPLPRLVR
jgi:hypothetical protein